MNDRNKMLADFLKQIELATNSKERESLIELIYLTGERNGFSNALDLSHSKLDNVA